MSEGRAHVYPFFTHRGCVHFPCHSDIDPDDFNCLFCYCPLYVLGPDCGGSFSYTEKGYKDCTACSLPHRGDAGTLHVKERFPEIASIAARRGEDDDFGC